MKTQVVPSEYQDTLFHWEVDQALTPISQRDCGIFIPGSHLDLVLGNQLCLVVLWTKLHPNVLFNLSHPVILWSRSKIWKLGAGSWEGKAVSEVQWGILSLLCKAGGWASLVSFPGVSCHLCCCKSSELLLLPIYWPNKPHPSHADPQSFSAFKNMNSLA